MNIKYNSTSKYTLEMAIKLSLQRALLCEISAKLRMAAVEWKETEKEIIIYFYFDGNVSEENKESANCIAAEVSADFDEETQVIDKCFHLDFPEKLPSHSITVYRRKE